VENSKFQAPSIQTSTKFQISNKPPAVEGDKLKVQSAKMASPGVKGKGTTQKNFPEVLREHFREVKYWFPTLRGWYL